MKHVKKFDSFIKESYETDNFIDIKGNDVFVCFRGIKSLVGVPQKVVGDFVCYSNPYLENLKYAPKYVGGKFVCSNNGLTSLEGGPKEVGGDYMCNSNRLVSLKGAPKVINGDFDCSENKLKNLDYLPEIKGKLFCAYNNWSKPIPYKIYKKYGLNKRNNIYTEEQLDKFSSFEFQKEFLEREPENYLDLKPFEYADGIEELFPDIF